MGSQLDLRMVGDKYDERQLSPFLGRDFKFEIAGGDIWMDRPPFLTPEERVLIEGPYYEDFDEYPPVTISPLELARVLTKIKDYLWTHQDSLQQEISLDYERMEQEGLSTYIIVNQSHCWIDNYPGRCFKEWWPVGKTEHQIRITSYPLEPNEVELWMDAGERLEIEGRTYYLKRTSPYEKFASALDKAIIFCTYADSIGEQVFWLHDC
ncbi:hypothetical protein [Hymenobacter sp. BT559]|uniref:hypothetical protein n=1 Tax=Hymenobacter sp. BT559 TaxID=2795729 RepID=UPI0018EA7CF4|nr:hypothetical protein [Hymenobacter sp. BT559]MBJ6145228.1 hypothetical protein [Hymenobacter sp. BT559]